MPRGNDVADARKELEDAGYGALIADDLLAAHAEKYPAELIAAQRHKTDPSVEIDLASVKVPKGQEVVSAAKKGDKVVYVALDKDGVAHKGVRDYDDVKATPALVGAGQAG
jgi:hypothetical protein